LIGDPLVVRLHGVLTAAEQQLVKSLSPEKGRDLLKQVRTHLIETARPVMEAMIQEATGIKVVSVHRRRSGALHPGSIAFLSRNQEEIELDENRKRRAAAGPPTRFPVSYLARSTITLRRVGVRINPLFLDVPSSTSYCHHLRGLRIV